MRALEHRPWFLILTFAISLGLMASLWLAEALPVTLAAGVPFVFAVLGLWRAVSPLAAVGLVRCVPRLGAIG